MSDDATHDINGIPHATEANTSLGDILIRFNIEMRNLR